MAKINRRKFLSRSAAVAVTTIAAPLMLASEARAWVWGIVAAAGAVMNYIGSKGNVTGSLLQANLNATLAVANNVREINNALQGITVQVADLYEIVQRQKYEIVDLDAKLDLRGSQDRILELRRGQLEGEKLNDPVDAKDRLNKIINIYESSFKAARTKYKELGEIYNFTGLLDVAAAASFDLQTLSLIISEAERITPELRPYGIGDVKVAIEQYLDYFDKSLELKFSNSLVAMNRAAIDAVMVSRLAFESAFPSTGKYNLGCEVKQVKFIEDRTEIFEDAGENGDRVFTASPAALYELTLQPYQLAVLEKRAPNNDSSFEVVLERLNSFNYQDVYSYENKGYFRMPELQCGDVLTEPYGNGRYFGRFNINEPIAQTIIEKFNRRIPDHLRLVANQRAILALIKVARRMQSDLKCQLRVIEEGISQCSP